MPFCDPSNAKRRFMPVLPANRGARRQRWRMADDFTYDVFLSHSSEDRAVVRSVAERLRADGLRVWLDDWEIKPGDSIPAKIEDGLEHSRVLVLCMSTHAFGSDWATLESQTFRFRDPLNQERRFIPLRVDEFETLGQWDRDLTRASRNPFFKLLVAGRVDAGGLRVSRSQVEGFRNERGYLDFLETGAKTKLGCEELIAKNSSKRSSTLRWWCGCITRGPSRRISSGVTPPTSRLSPGSNWV
jgi:hypothetical protein